jgi:hypothetical protein
VPGEISPSLVLFALLAVWFAATIATWWVATYTFNILSIQKNPGLSQKFEALPPLRRKAVLRHTAGELNRHLFRGWNRAQLLLGALGLLIVFLGQRNGAFRKGRTLLFFLTCAGLVIVATHAFWLSPGIERLGRALDFADRAEVADAVKLFGLYHGAYVISDLIKAALLLWAASLAYRAGTRRS